MVGKPIAENVQRRSVDHVTAAGVEDGKDVSSEKRSWKNYFWDSFDKSPEVRDSWTMFFCFSQNTPQKKNTNVSRNVV